MRRDERGRRRGGEGTIMFRSEGEDECSHPIQLLSLLNLTHGGRWKKTTKACGQTAENQESRDEFSARDADKDRKTGKSQSGKKLHALNTALAAKSQL